MSCSLPQKLRDGAFTAFGNLADQQLALRCIQSINLVDMMMACPSTFLQLPATLQAFPKLRFGILSFGYSVYDEDLSVLSWIQRVDQVWLVTRLLRKLGVSHRVELCICLQEQVRESEFFQFLLNDVCPRLWAEVVNIQKAEAKERAVSKSD